jgi:hypothetical protein
MLQPVLHRRPDRIPRRRLQPDVELRVQRPELVPDLLLGLARDLPAQPLPSGPKPTETELLETPSDLVGATGFEPVTPRL